jgi:hypothetical protein
MVSNNDSPIKKLIRFFTQDYSGIVFILTTLVYAVTLLNIHLNPIFLYFVLILNFSSFDRIGWFHLNPSIDTQIVGYRIIQHGYLILLGASLFHINVDVSIAFLISWYMGVCDLLYYIIGKEYKYYYYANMYWLWWCPWTYVGIEKNGKNLTIWSLIAMFISILIITL